MIKKPPGDAAEYETTSKQKSNDNYSRREQNPTQAFFQADGSSPVIAFGVCWSENANPTLEDNFTESAPGISKSSYDTLKGIEYNTTYYVRAYATNSAGTAYGESIEVIVYMNHPQENAVDIDGNVYKPYALVIRCGWWKILRRPGIAMVMLSPMLPAQLPGRA